MNRILFLLLFIPLLSFSQSYSDVMSINSLNIFKKVMIENDYQFEGVDDDGVVTYGYVFSRGSDFPDNTRSKVGVYNPKNNVWELTFLDPEYEIIETPYDVIFERVKENCNYFKIINSNGNDFVTYDCNGSSFKGKIGFISSENVGKIRFFHPTN